MDIDKFITLRPRLHFSIFKMSDDRTAERHARVHHRGQFPHRVLCVDIYRHIQYMIYYRAWTHSLLNRYCSLTVLFW